MYETLSTAQIHRLLPMLDKQIDRFVYTAEKNLAPFPATFRRDKDFIKIHNALPLTALSPVSRQSLGIDDKAFVLSMVARAIVDKGWQEAIDAVISAHKNSPRPIHLLLIGGKDRNIRV